MFTVSKKLYRETNGYDPKLSDKWDTCKQTILFDRLGIDRTSRRNSSSYFWSEGDYGNYPSIYSLHPNKVPTKAVWLNHKFSLRRGVLTQR